jgi:hypothetical protein
MSIRKRYTLKAMGFSLQDRFPFENPTGKAVYWLFQREAVEP